MEKRRWKPYAFFILLAETVGALSGFLSRNGMESYQMLQKPERTPPDIAFPIVWIVLYALMGIGAARIWLLPLGKERTRSLGLSAFQLAVNFFWSLLFFNLQAFGLSFIWLCFLLVLILMMIASYQEIDKTAAWLQVPYLLWVTFAGYLTYMVWMLNQ